LRVVQLPVQHCSSAVQLASNELQHCGVVLKLHSGGWQVLPCAAEQLPVQHCEGLTPGSHGLPFSRQVGTNAVHLPAALQVASQHWLPVVQSAPFSRHVSAQRLVPSQKLVQQSWLLSHVAPTVLQTGGVAH
jgi:hypothetical protein